MSEGDIRQIMPATGWRVVIVTDGKDPYDVREEPIVCWALLEPPYVDREDGPPEIVLPMLIDMANVTLADAAWWDNEGEQFNRWLVSYLAPGEEQSEWVRSVAADIAVRHLGVNREVAEGHSRSPIPMPPRSDRDQPE